MQRGQRRDDPPPQTELVIGLVGAVGINLKAVVAELKFVLSRFAYQVHDLHLTDQLSALDWSWPLVQGPYDERVSSYMTAGNKLREHWERRDAFALLALNEISIAREKVSGRSDTPQDRHAYVLRSLKRREEVTLLRDVYGSRFILLSIYAPEKARLRYLKKRIRQSRVIPADPRPKFKAAELIERDNSEPGEYGQDLEGTFYRGDFFIDATSNMRSQLKRTMKILFGHPHCTPTRDEFGMFQAVAAAKRSADLGRQVGASICTADGAVVAVGTNEVPRAGGGLYWPGDRDDAREFVKGGDSSDKRKRQIVKAIASDLGQSKLLKEEKGKADLKAVREVIEESEIKNLIEFVRAVHAEMAALMEAARRGIPVADTVLFATTFPCHHCARHIVASGIKRVVYIAPYPKSLVQDLHDDSIKVDPSHRQREHRRVTFEPFVGIGPRRYLELFEMPKRKTGRSGKKIKFRPRVAMPRLADLETEELRTDALPYIRREQRALGLLARIQKDRGPRLVGLSESGRVPISSRVPGTARRLLRRRRPRSYRP